jgi:hypothetical protein
MKTGYRFYGMTILLLAATFSAIAGNKIAVIRATSNALEVQLANTEEVFGVQFSLRTSSDITLGELERGIRTSGSNWIVASYKPNDSTMNVLILNVERKNFADGQGSIARIPFTKSITSDMSFASLSNVMITNSHADSLGIAINNLSWSNKSILMANNDESKLFDFGQNYPNPFNPTTRIAYKLNKAAQVRLSVYDITGREVNRLIDQYQSVGEYNVEWNSQTGSGQKLASGMYVARLSVDNESISRKMVLAK